MTLDDLTPRQRECLAATCRLGTCKGAAAELFISVQTVKNHLSDGYARAGLEGLVNGCLELGKEIGRQESRESGGREGGE